MSMMEFHTSRYTHNRGRICLAGKRLVCFRPRGLNDMDMTEEHWNRASVKGIFQLGMTRQYSHPFPLIVFSVHLTQTCLYGQGLESSRRPGEGQRPLGTSFVERKRKEKLAWTNKNKEKVLETAVGVRERAKASNKHFCTDCKMPLQSANALVRPGVAKAMLSKSE